MRGRLLHKFAIGLIVFAMVMLCSCENRQLQERFDTVERIAADYPDSAIGLLKEVKDTKFSKSEQARYDLLLAEARYMSGENDTIAGRLTDIAEYYDRKGDKHNAARAYYYEGIIYANNHKPLKSIISHLKVLNTKIGDPILRGRAYRAIAENYEVLMDYESALRYYELSYHAFTEAPNNKYTDYSIMDISRAYFAVAKYDSSLCYAEEVLANATRDHNESLHASALRIKGKNEIEFQQYRNAVDSYNLLMSTDSASVIAEDYRNLGIAYLNLGKVEEANRCNRILFGIDPNDKYLEFYIVKSTGNADLALKLLSDLTTTQSEYLQNMWQSGQAQLITDYYQIENQKITTELKKDKQIKLLLITLFILFAIIFVIAICTTIRRSKVKQERVLIRLKSVQHELKQKADELTRITSAANDLVLPAFGEQLSLLLKYIEHSQENSNLNDKLENEVAYLSISEISAIICSVENVEKIAISIDSLKGNIITNLKRDVKNITHNDCLIFIFSILCISSELQAVLLGIRLEALYNRRSKLRNKIAKSACARKESYLNIVK